MPDQFGGCFRALAIGAPVLAAAGVAVLVGGIAAVSIDALYDPVIKPLIQQGVSDLGDLTQAAFNYVDDLWAKTGNDAVDFFDRAVGSLQDIADGVYGLAQDIGLPLDNLGELLPDLPLWLADPLQTLADAPGILWGAGAALGSYDPLTLDLNGDGQINLLSAQNGVHFDFLGDGYAERTGWVAPEDGMLVWDKDADGLIEGHEELIASPEALSFIQDTRLDELEHELNGFALLAAQDGNTDGVIDANDAIYNTLQVWIDANSNGVSEAGELHSLASLNIESINVGNVDFDFVGVLNGSFNRIIEGNTVTHSSSFTLTGGTEREIVDVWFDSDLTNTYYTNDYTLDIRTLFLPTLRGYGNLPDLHIAMSQDETLLTAVEDFATARTVDDLFSDFSGVRDEVRALLMSWAEVADDMLASESEISADGVFSHMAEYQFLAELTGIENPYMGTWFDGRPFLPWPDEGIPAVSASWEGILDAFTARLVFQSGGSALFTAASYNPLSDTFEGDLSLSETAIDALATALTAHADLEGAWNALARFLDNTVGLANLSGTETGWLDGAVDTSSASALGWSDILATLDDHVTDGVSGDDTVNGTRWNDVLNADYNGDLNDGNETINGFDGDDILHGGDGDDILVGGAGNDVYYGGWGSDTYVYESGHDVIDDQGGNSVLVDTEIIKFAAGIAPEDVTLHVARLDAAGTEHVFLDVAGRGTITIKNDGAWWTDASEQIDELHFADNTVLSFPALAATIYGTNGNDALTTWNFNTNPTILGFDGDDTIELGWTTGSSIADGGNGNDTLSGSEYDDTYIFSPGNDVIYDPYGGDDTILVPDGYDADDARFYRKIDSTAGLSDAYIEIEGLGTIKIEIQYEAYPTTDEFVETLKFADATEIDLKQKAFDIIGTSGDDVFTDNSRWEGQDNIYVFGQGTDTMIENYGGVDTILFENLQYADVTLERRQGATPGLGGNTNNLVIHDQNGNSFYVARHFQYSNGITFDSDHSIEYLQFSDSTIVNISEIEIDAHGTSGNDNIFGAETGDLSTDDTIYGHEGNDYLDGLDGNDTLYGGAGADTLAGGSGVDIFAYEAAGDAGDTIVDFDAAGGEKIDVLGIFENITGFASAYAFTGGYIRAAQNNYDVDIFIDVDGSAGSSASEVLLAKLLDVQVGDIGSGSFILPDSGTVGTSGNDTITGTAADDVIYGLAGNDSLSGEGGSDTLYGDEGNDTLSGGAGDDTLNGGAGNDTSYGDDGDDTFYIGTGENQLYGGNGADIFVIDENSFDASASPYSNVDYIHDFDVGEGDVISIDSILLGYIPGTSAITNFVLLAPTTGGDTRVYVDRDGTSGAYGWGITSWLENVNLSDEQALLNSGNLQVTINAFPVADDDSFSGTEDQNITGNLLVDNGSGADSDPDGDPLHVQEETKATVQGGSVAILSSGSFVYTPAADFEGTDSFGYTLHDDRGGTDTATATLSVSNVNDAPVAADDAFSGVKNAAINGNLMNNNGSGPDSDIDNDTLDVTAETKPTAQGGSVTILANGTFTYTPDTDFVGQDDFTYTLNDGNSGSDTGTVTLTLTAYNLITGTSGNDTLTGTSGQDDIEGLGGNDTLTGNGGDDILDGGAGNDTLYGNDGDDVFYIGAGENQLYGGNGADIFVIDANSFDASANPYSNVDYIHDFDVGEGDVILIENVLQGYDPGTSDITNFVLLAPNTGGDTRVYVDRDGTGGAYSWGITGWLENVNVSDEQALLNSGNLQVA